MFFCSRVIFAFVSSLFLGRWREVQGQLLQLVDRHLVLDLLVLDFGLQLLQPHVQLLDGGVATRQLVDHRLHRLLQHQVRVLQRLDAGNTEEVDELGGS